MLQMDPRDKALLKMVFLLILALLIYSIFVRPAGASERELSFNWDDTREVYAEKIDKFLVLYFSKSSPRKLNRARKLVPDVLDASKRHDVNPILIASIISHESTWDYAAIGALGEIGLMQVNNRVVGKDPSDQLDIGITMLKQSYERCGSVIGAVSYYATGHTCKPYRGAEKRVALAKKIEAL